MGQFSVTFSYLTGSDLNDIQHRAIAEQTTTIGLMSREGDGKHWASAHLLLAKSALLDDNFDLAEKSLTEAVTVFEALDIPYGLAKSLLARSELLLVRYEREPISEDLEAVQADLLAARKFFELGLCVSELAQCEALQHRIGSSLN